MRHYTFGLGPKSRTLFQITQFIPELTPKSAFQFLYVHGVCIQGGS